MCLWRADMVWHVSDYTHSGAPLGETGTVLGGLVDDFGAYYRPTDEQLRDAYGSGIVVLDTNVLLDLYRLSPAARGSMVSLLEALASRVFVPHQVALEFHRNRASAVADRRSEIESSRSQLAELHAKARGLVRQISTRAYGDSRRALDAEHWLQQAFDAAIGFSDSAAEEYDLNEDSIVGTYDPILESLATVLDGRVAPKPPAEVLAADHAEAQRRHQAKEPPGFRDGGKNDNAYGDYLWWAETVRHARANPAPVVIVGNDTSKGDWALVSRGIRIGLDPRLADEIRAAAGRALFLRSTSQFLEDGGRLLNVPVTPEAVNEARSLPGAGRPGQYVSFDDVSTITGMGDDEIEMMQSQGWLPIDEPQWHWLDVRRAAILGHLVRRGVSQPHLDRISDFTTAPHPPAHNILIVLEDECVWVRSKGIDRYLDGLDQPPITTVRLRDFEGKMRTIQASLQRARSNDRDE